LANESPAWYLVLTRSLMKQRLKVWVVTHDLTSSQSIEILARDDYGLGKL